MKKTKKINYFQDRIYYLKLCLTEPTPPDVEKLVKYKIITLEQEIERLKNEKN